MYEVLGKAIERSFMVMMTVWVVWKTRDSTKDLVLCGEKVLGEKAKERRECVPYISISQMFIQLP